METTNAYTFNSTSEAPLSYALGTGGLVIIDPEGSATVASLAALMQTWLAERGYEQNRGAAGGGNVATIPPVGTAVAAAA